jgi:hypothetical protein
MTQWVKMAAENFMPTFKMAESEDNLSNIESEDEEIARILDGRHAEKYNKGNKKCSKNIFRRSRGGRMTHR